jgi:hypothetical protein
MKLFLGTGTYSEGFKKQFSTADFAAAVDKISAVGERRDPAEKAETPEGKIAAAIATAIGQAGERRSKGIPPKPAATKGAVAPDPEAGLDDADLWQKKRSEGMNQQQATAYVQARTRGKK